MAIEILSAKITEEMKKSAEEASNLCHMKCDGKFIEVTIPTIEPSISKVYRFSKKEFKEVLQQLYVE